MAKTGTAKKSATKAPAKGKQAQAKKQPAKSKQAPKTEEPELNEEMIEEIEGMLSDLKEDMNKSMKNASAAKRARKTTSNLEKEFKKFRKASIAHHKKED